MSILVVASQPFNSTSAPGVNGGSSVQSDGSYTFSFAQVSFGASIAATEVAINYVSDIGRRGIFSFAFNPTSGTMEAQLVAALETAYPGTTFVLSYVSP